jgi:hypothetical protein
LIGVEDRVGLNTECTEFAEKEGIPHPPVFFVRVADKGLVLDAASTLADAGFEAVAFLASCEWLVPLGSSRGERVALRSSVRGSGQAGEGVAGVVARDD